MGFGWQQMLILAGVIVLLFGAKRLPATMRSIGRSVTEFKKGINDADDPSGGTPPADDTPAHDTPADDTPADAS